MALLPWLLHLGSADRRRGACGALLMTTLPAGTPLRRGSGRLVERSRTAQRLRREIRTAWTSTPS